jgi:23S rRNA A1618 N6-methylase RlmF
MFNYNKENIVFVEYDGAGRPHRVFTDDLTGFDFFFKDGFIQCEYCSLGVRPFLNKLIPECKVRGKLKVWFKKIFRPKNNSIENEKILTNKEIEEMGYVITNEPKYLDEIIDALHDC